MNEELSVSSSSFIVHHSLFIIHRSELAFGLAMALKEEGFIVLHLRVERNFGRATAFLSAAFVCLTLLTLEARAQVRRSQDKAEDVVRVESELVQTDVMVFDKSGKFVDGLGREQFELRVDGRTVPVAFFERVMARGPKAVEPGGKRSASVSAASDAASQASGAARGRTIIFFIDDLHLSLDSLGRTRSALTHFIDEEMAAGDLVAFVTASAQLGFLQQFTDNKAVLRAAIARLRPVPDTVRDTEQPPMSEFIAIRIANGDRNAADFYIDKILEGFATKGNSRGMNRNGVFEMVRGRATNITKGYESVTDASLGSLENLVRTSGQIQGRKLVFFISDGFYLESKNSAAASNNRLQLVTDTAARTGSVIYSIDARGLFAPFHDATGEKARDPMGRLDRASIGEAVLSQDGLAALASDTGGQFLKNTNYFDRWVSRVLEETSNFYRIAWRPESEAREGRRFRRVEVTIAGRPELNVRLHRGYVPAAARVADESKRAEDKTSGVKADEKTDAKADAKADAKNDAKADAKGTTAKGAMKEIESDFRAALSSPVAKLGLPTVLSTSFVDVPGSGVVLTSSVEVSTDALDYGADGKQPASVDLVGVVWNDQGRPVANFKTRLNVTPTTHASVSAEMPGVIYNYRAQVAPGLYQVKAAARDSREGLLGSAAQWIEIPDLSKRQLTLSSLHLGGRAVASATGAAKDSKETPRIQFSVDRRFPRSSRLDFLAFIYNAARAGGVGTVDLAVEVRLLREGKAVVTAPARKLTPDAGADLARIPLTGAISLGQLPTGTYEIEINVTDNLAHTHARAGLGFEIR
jgi:VWFA-related protein